MKRILFPLLAAVAGLGAGGGAAFVAVKMAGGSNSAAATATAAPIEAPKTSFVPVTKILAPLVTKDGRLSGYVSFEVELEVAAEQSDYITARLPMLRHAINMRTYRTPMAAGPDGMLPDLTAFRAVVTDSAKEAFGAHTVRLVAITQAVPS
jgi:hypothetical protein